MGLKAVWKAACEIPSKCGCVAYAGCPGLNFFSSLARDQALDAPFWLLKGWPHSWAHASLFTTLMGHPPHLPRLSRVGWAMASFLSRLCHHHTSHHPSWHLLGDRVTHSLEVPVSPMTAEAMGIISVSEKHCIQISIVQWGSWEPEWFVGKILSPGLLYHIPWNVGNAKETFTWGDDKALCKGCTAPKLSVTITV